MKSYTDFNIPVPNPTYNGVYGLQVMASEAPSEVEFWEASGSLTVTSSYQLVYSTPAVVGGFTTYTNVSPNDGLYRWLKARHVRLYASASAYTVPVSVLPWGTINYPAPTNPIRNAPNSNQYAAGAEDVDGNILSATVGKTDGASGNKQLVFGGEKGTCRHRQGILFTNTYNSVPRVTLAGGNYITTQPGNKWGSLSVINANQTGSGAPSSSLETFLSLTATGITTAGFTASCLLYAQSGSVTLTARSHDFTGTGLTAVGDTTAGVSTTSAPAYNDTFTINSTGSVTYSAKGAGPWGLAITVAVDVYDLYGTGLWTEVGTMLYDFELDGGSTFSQTITSTDIVLSLASTNQFRLRIKSASQTGLFNSISYIIKGYGMSGVPTGGITYSTSVSNLGKYYTSATPYTDNYCEWKVEGTTS